MRERWGREPRHATATSHPRRIRSTAIHFSGIADEWWLVISHCAPSQWYVNV